MFFFSVGIAAVLALMPLITVRAELVLRLDAERLPLGSLTSWSDTSGNTNDVAQSNTGYRPYVVNLKTEFNGRNVVKFDGSDDYLINTNVSYTAKTVVTVFRVDSLLRVTSDLGQIWGQYSKGHVATDYRSGGGGWSFNGSTSTQAYFGLDGAALSVTAYGDTYTQPWSDNTVHLVTVQFASNLAIDQQTIGSLQPYMSGHNYGGQIAEVLVFDTTLTSDEKTGLEYLMAERWGVTNLITTASQTQIDAANALFPEGVYYVPVSLVLRLDARDLPLGPLALWPDVSGNTNGVSQGNSSLRPTVVRLSGDFNGRKVVQFDGVNDYLDSNTVNYNARTVLTVFRVDSSLRDTNDLGQIWGQYDTAHVATDFRYLAGYPSCWSFDGGTGNKARFGLDGAYLSSASYEDTDAQPWSDDTVHLVNVQYTGLIAMDQHTIGSCMPDHGLYYGGQVAEILVFNDVLSWVEQKGLEYLMADRWGVAGVATATQAQIDAANALFPDGVYFKQRKFLIMIR